MQPNQARLALDWWSVIIAFGVMALIKFGVLPSVPW